MIGGLLLVGLAILGLCWLFGFGKPERLLKFVIWVIAGPLILGLLYNEWLCFYVDLPFLGQAALIVVVPFLILFSLRVLFPGSKVVSTITAVTWDLLIFALTFPLSLVLRSGRQFAARESSRIHLQKNRPVVGGRPPSQKRASNENREWL